MKTFLDIFIIKYIFIYLFILQFYNLKLFIKHVKRAFESLLCTRRRSYTALLWPHGANA